MISQQQDSVSVIKPGVSLYTMFQRDILPRGTGSRDMSGNGDGEATELRRFQIIHKATKTLSSLLRGI